MNKLSKLSQAKLDTCDPKIIEIINDVLKEIDISVIYGHRTIEEQLELYGQGRDLVDGQWIITDKRNIVTYCDGMQKKSKHNEFPSQAIDIAPYPIDWKNINRFSVMAEIFQRVAKEKGISVTWGGNFKSLKDYPHFELGIKGA